MNNKGTQKSFFFLQFAPAKTETGTKKMQKRMFSAKTQKFLFG
jgi:hypothetical protein